MNYKKKYKKIIKPWGSYQILEKTLNYWIKKILVNKGTRLSLQSHKYRSEIWVVLKGKISAQKGNANYVLTKGEFLKIGKEEKHRISGLTKAWILEIALGKTKERDIIRYQDDYDRIK